jgi:hypothetical protein
MEAALSLHYDPVQMDPMIARAAGTTGIVRNIRFAGADAPAAGT